jgi:hypothetical protein
MSAETVSAHSRCAGLLPIEPSEERPVIDGLRYFAAQYITADAATNPTNQTTDGT